MQAVSLSKQYLFRTDHHPRHCEWQDQRSCQPSNLVEIMPIEYYCRHSIHSNPISAARVQAVKVYLIEETQ